MRKSKLLMWLFFVVAPIMVFGQAKKKEKFEKIFNGKNLEGWYTFVDSYGKNNDPLKVFTIEKSLLHVSGEKFAYVCTSKSYSNFHLKLEFKWGEKKWEPRLAAPRDSGILYLIPEDSVDKIWPSGIECQIQEGDTGDFWMIFNSTVVVDGVKTIPAPYTRSIKKKNTELPNGQWNTVEVIHENGRLRHIVNGVLVNEATDASTRKGRLLLQSEGAELFYRNIQLKEL